MFDIGAHEGNFTDTFLANEAGRVLSIEPQVDVFESLQNRFRDNDDVICLCCAAGASPDFLPIYLCVQANTLSSLTEKWMFGRFKGYAFVKSDYRVEVVTLDSLIEKYGEPDYIKIDVEGYEFQVLAGLSTAINSISFEHTGEYKGDAFACCDRLLQLGDYEFSYSRGDVESLETAWLPWEEFYPIIFSAFDEEGMWGDVFARLALR